MAFVFWCLNNGSNGCVRGVKLDIESYQGTGEVFWRLDLGAVRNHESSPLLTYQNIHK